MVIIPTEEERFLTITYPKVRPGYYEVSNYGCVRRIKDGKILKPDVDKDGYLKIELVTEDTKRPCKCFVHRLVAWEFIGPTPVDKPLVNHKNSCRDFNYYENLEWCTAKENTNHGIVFGNIRHGPKFSYRKYDDGAIDTYIRHILSGWSTTEILNHYNLRGKKRKLVANLIYDIRSGRSHRYDVARVSKDIVSTTIQLPR